MNQKLSKKIRRATKLDLIAANVELTDPAYHTKAKSIAKAYKRDLNATPKNKRCQWKEKNL